VLENVRIGLALGGGAARGLAHIGVLHELERARIPIHILTGTSIGSLVGAVQATSRNAREVEERFSSFVRSPEFRRAEFDFLKQ
jgi:NTE family protein